MDHRPSPGSLRLLRARIVGLATAATMMLSAALSGALTAAASTEDVYWTTVAQVSGVAGQSTSVKAVAMRSGGIPIVAGQFRGVATFPTGPGTSVTRTDDSTTIFVAALTPDGEYFDWVTTATGVSTLSQFAAVNSVTVSADDTIYIGGQFYGTAYLPTGPAQDDSIALVAPDSNQSAFVAAIPAGSQYFAWAQKVGKSGGSSSVKSVSVTSDGAPIVTGSSSGNAYFPTGRPAPDDSVAVSGESLFVAKVNADDSYFTWVQPIPRGSSGDAASIAVTGDDTTVITGWFQRSLTFPTGPSSSLVLTNDDTSDVFVAAISADDSYFAWAQRAGDDPMVGSASASSTSVAVSQDGSPLITGYFAGTAYFPTGRPAPDDSIAVTSLGSNDIFVAAMTADDSYFSSVQRAGGTGSDVARAIAVSPSGGAVVVGDFEGTASFPAAAGAAPLALTSAGNRDVFVSGMNADDPTFSWVQRAGGADRDLGSVVVAAPNGDPFVGGTFAATASFPTGASSVIELTAVGTSNVFTGFLAAATPTPSTPVPAIPASEPLSVVATAGDSSASVSWSAPASSGSFPVSHYLATSTPGAHTCLVAAPALTCDVRGLTNGTAYTFTVSALTGAGWSVSSEASNVVVPRPSAEPSIVITGSRDGKRIEVTGTTTGFGMGAILNPWIRLAGQSAYTQGSARVLVSMDGTFSWGRTTGKKASVYMQTPDESARSNTVTITAR